MGSVSTISCVAISNVPCRRRPFSPSFGAVHSWGVDGYAQGCSCFFRSQWAVLGVPAELALDLPVCSCCFNDARKNKSVAWTGPGFGVIGGAGHGGDRQVKLGDASATRAPKGSGKLNFRVGSSPRPISSTSIVRCVQQHGHLSPSALSRIEIATSTFGGGDLATLTRGWRKSNANRTAEVFAHEWPLLGIGTNYRIENL